MVDAAEQPARCDIDTRGIGGVLSIDALDKRTRAYRNKLGTFRSTGEDRVYRNFVPITTYAAAPNRPRILRPA